MPSETENRCRVLAKLLGWKLSYNTNHPVCDQLVAIDADGTICWRETWEEMWDVMTQLNYPVDTTKE